MRYEPCTGRCYAPSDVLRLSGLKERTDAVVELLKKVIAIHEPACGNDQLAYGLDLDEETGLFVAHFQHYGAIDLFSGQTVVEALVRLADRALEYYQTEDYKQAVAARPGQGHDVCEHGKNHDLAHFALRYSGLPAETRSEVLAQLAPS